MSVKHEAPHRREIRRYANRKLYEARERRYVTVADVGAMVAAGDDVQVEDQKTGEDLTSQVLAQVLLERLKDRTARIPRQVLVALIRLDGGRVPALPDPQQLAARAKAEAERIAAGLLSRGRLTLDDALGLRQELARSLHDALHEAQRALEGRVQGLLGHREGDGRSQATTGATATPRRARRAPHRN